jgi:alkanesulfonate monooxygenase SsuD/methylene tetrahydromethanopterin reductase-like flavin-dependent oxidoreductase (luciferase family)
MQEWFENGPCDGFNITPTHLPSGCEDFVELVVPEFPAARAVPYRI